MFSHDPSAQKGSRPTRTRSGCAPSFEQKKKVISVALIVAIITPHSWRDSDQLSILELPGFNPVRLGGDHRSFVAERSEASGLSACPVFLKRTSRDADQPQSESGESQWESFPRSLLLIADLEDRDASMENIIKRPSFSFQFSRVRYSRRSRLWNAGVSPDRRPRRFLIVSTSSMDRMGPASSYRGRPLIIPLSPLIHYSRRSISWHGCGYLYRRPPRFSGLGVNGSGGARASSFATRSLSGQPGLSRLEQHTPNLPRLPGSWSEGDRAVLERTSGIIAANATPPVILDVNRDEGEKDTSCSLRQLRRVQPPKNLRAMLFAGNLFP